MNSVIFSIKWQHYLLKDVVLTLRSRVGILWSLINDSCLYFVLLHCSNCLAVCGLIFINNVEFLGCCIFFICSCKWCVVSIYFAEIRVGCKSINILWSGEKTLKIFKYSDMLLVKSILRKMSDSNYLDAGLNWEWILPTTLSMYIIYKFN